MGLELWCTIRHFKFRSTSFFRRRSSTAYMISYSDSLGSFRPQPCVINASKPTCTISGLAAGDSYTFQIAALTNAGLGEWSDPVTVLLGRLTWILGFASASFPLRSFWRPMRFPSLCSSCQRSIYLCCFLHFTSISHLSTCIRFWRNAQVSLCFFFFCLTRNLQCPGEWFNLSSVNGAFFCPSNQTGVYIYTKTDTEGCHVKHHPQLPSLLLQSIPLRVCYHHVDHTRNLVLFQIVLMLNRLMKYRLRLFIDLSLLYLYSSPCFFLGVLLSHASVSFSLYCISNGISKCCRLYGLIFPFPLSIRFSQIFSDQDGLSRYPSLFFDSNATLHWPIECDDSIDRSDEEISLSVICTPFHFHQHLVCLSIFPLALYRFTLFSSAGLLIVSSSIFP